VETTRQTILGILRRRSATIEELTKELGLAPATVRRHLDILSRDGHVSVGQVRRKTGRPHYVFSLTDSGRDLFPKHYVRITNRLIEEILALTPDETSGASGSEIADLVFDKMAQRLAQRVLPRVYGSDLRERIESAREALAAEGIAFEVEERDGAYLLSGRGCPCPGGGSQACSHDARLLTLLLGADVSFVRPGNSDGEALAAYLVRPAAEATAGLSTARALV
jgi:predicted ArsR family transcriptional regulator